MCTHGYTCGGQSDAERLPLLLSTSYFKAGSLMETRAYQFCCVGWPANHRAPSVSFSSTLILHVHALAF